MGFGFGIVAMSLLPLVLPVKEASPLVVIFTLPVVVFAFCGYWRHFQWRDSWALLLGSIVGVPLGVYLLTIAPGPLLLKLLGGMFLCFAAYELYSHSRPQLKVDFPRWSAFPVGVFSGAASGAFNAGGPALVSYAYAQTWSKERKMAFLQAFFVFSGAIRFSTMLGGGLFTPDVIKLIIWGSVPVFLALWMGSQVLRRADPEKLKQAVYFFIGVISLKYLFWT